MVLLNVSGSIVIWRTPSLRNTRLPVVFRSLARYGPNLFWSARPQRKTPVFFDVSVMTSWWARKQNWQWIFSRFRWWNSVKFGRLPYIYFSLELFFQENIFDRQFFSRGQRCKFAKKKTAWTNLTFLVFKIRIPPGSGCTVKIVEDFSAGNSWKSQIKTCLWTVKNAFVWAVNSTLKVKIWLCDHYFIIAYYI